MWFTQGAFSVLGYTTVQSAQVLCLSFRCGSCVKMFAGSRGRRLVHPFRGTHLDTETSIDNVKGVAGVNAEFLSTLHYTVKRYLDENARRWVDMQSLFSFMKI